MLGTVARRGRGGRLGADLWVVYSKIGYKKKEKREKKDIESFRRGFGTAPPISLLKILTESAGGTQWSDGTDPRPPLLQPGPASRKAPPRPTTGAVQVRGLLGAHGAGVCEVSAPHSTAQGAAGGRVCEGHRTQTREGEGGGMAPDARGSGPSWSAGCDLKVGCDKARKRGFRKCLQTGRLCKSGKSTANRFYGAARSICGPRGKKGHHGTGWEGVKCGSR